MKKSKEIDHLIEDILESEPDIGVIGTGWFKLSERLDPEDPFMPAAWNHDLRFEIVPETGEKPTYKDIVKADELFLEQCLRIAKDKKSLYLKMRAYLFYRIVRLYSSTYWRLENG